MVTITQLQSFFDVEELRTKLADGREQGLKRARRIQRPTILLGTLLFLACLPAGLIGASAIAVAISLIAFASYMLVLALTPMQPRAVWCMELFLCLAFFIPIVLFFALDFAIYIGIIRSGCTNVANPARACSLWTTLFVVRALVNVINILVCVYLGWNLRPGVSAARRVDVIWRAYGTTFTALGLAAVFAVCAGLYRQGGEITDNPASSAELSGFAMLFFGLLGLNKYVRARVQAWLASIGGEVSVAVSISTMMSTEAGLRTDEDMLTRAQGMLRSISAADITLNAFSGTEDQLMASVPARLGEIDAFVSHSWWDDPAGRFEAFQAWRAKFKREYKREPTVWLDKYCLPNNDQAQLTRSLPCLPIFLSGCRELVVLRGPTMLSRMWCLMELFMYLVMRGSSDGIEVITFGGAAALINVEATPENASAFDVFVSRADGHFDARRAVCTFQADHTFLSQVMDVYPGGIHNFNRAILAALVQGERRWNSRPPPPGSARVAAEGNSVFTTLISVAPAGESAGQQA